MRNLMVRLAAFGMGCALCVGTAACGTEYVVPPMPEQAMQKQITTEKEGVDTSGIEEAQDAVSEVPFEEASVADELLAEVPMEETTLAGEEAAETTVVEVEIAETAIAETAVAGELISETATAETTAAGVSVAETTVSEVPIVETANENKIAGRYVASYVVTEERTTEILDMMGLEDTYGYFAGKDGVFDVIMDLKEDGSAVLSYDTERWVTIMGDNLVNKFNDIMLVKFEEEGISREELEKMMKREGFKNLEDGLADLRGMFEKELYPKLREGMQKIQNLRYEMNWTYEGNTLYLNGGGAVQRNNDGSFDYTMPEEQSIAGGIYQLHFVPVSK